jgi:NADH-quinone oxidoreductase subunit C
MLVLHTSRDQLRAVIENLRDRFAFALLLDITAIDHPQRTPRFEAVYHLYSRTLNRRVRVKAGVPEDDPRIATLTDMYGAARFLERETHDMYGIVFTGNQDLRPILLCEGFVGHPLRKDYAMEAEQPIVGYRDAPGSRP